MVASEEVGYQAGWDGIQCRPPQCIRTQPIMRFILLLALLLQVEVAQGAAKRPLSTNLAFSNSVGVDSPRDRRLQDQFQWYIRPLENFPELGAFLENGDDNTIEFRYNFAGDSNDPDRSFDVTLWKKDCLTPGEQGSDASLFFTQSVTGNELDVSVGVGLETIKDSPYYNQTAIAQAEIAFCVRVDYNYKDDSINFHETKITVAVDLQAGFSLTEIITNFTLAGQADLEDQIGCDVYEFFCDERFQEIPDPVLAQGSALTACIKSTGMFNIRDVMEANLDQDRDGDGRWDVHDDIITDYNPNVLTSKQVSPCLAHKPVHPVGESLIPFFWCQCALGMCKIKTQLASKYFIDPRPANLTISGVVVCGFGASASVYIGQALKPPIAENSTAVTYPVRTSLHDDDGSDEWDSMVVTYSVPGSGAPPIVSLGTLPDGVNLEAYAGGFTLTGNSSGIDEAMATLQVQPGTSNGEDIAITVVGTARAKGQQATAVTEASFVIPVDPVVQTNLELVQPGSVTGLEDTNIVISGVAFTYDGFEDMDGSEATVLEIAVSSYPSGTKLYAGAVLVRALSDGWMQVPTSLLSSFKVRPPKDFSGVIILSVRGSILDTTESNSVIMATRPQNLTVHVNPVADAPITGGVAIGVEDKGPVAFGAKIASPTSGVRASDNGKGTGNNPETETIIQIIVNVPADTSLVTYTVSGEYALTNGTNDGAGSAVVSYDVEKRCYTISSTLVDPSGDVSQISQEDRERAEADIRSTIATFSVEIGPEHQDVNGNLQVAVTVADVMNGVADKATRTFNPIRIQAVADAPDVIVVSPADTVDEDTAAISLHITALRSADDDGSESLSVRITVPRDGLGVLGMIGGPTPPQVTLSDLGGGVYLVNARGETGLDRQNALNSYLDGTIHFTPRNGYSGDRLGEDGIRVDVISTEAASGSEVAAGSSGGSDGTSQTETVTKYISLSVTPVADVAVVSVKGNAAGRKDVRGHGP